MAIKFISSIISRNRVFLTQKKREKKIDNLKGQIFELKII